MSEILAAGLRLWPHAQGRRAFWELQDHVKTNEIAATSPVVLTLGDELKTVATALVYGRPTDGEAGAVGDIEVLDLAPVDVLSVGIRGRRNTEAMAMARKILEARLAAEGLAAAGPWRALSYNSPMVPAKRQYWELQIPVK